MNVAVELGRDSVSKHQIQPEHGDEQADAERDCRVKIHSYTGEGESQEITMTLDGAK